MKRLPVLTFIVALLCGAALLCWLYLFPKPVIPHTGLLHRPDDISRYSLCSEGYSYAHATNSNPYKTDYTFQDPFRHVNDNIAPRLQGYDPATDTASFTVDISINQIGTFHESISHIHELDGVFVILPDTHNHPRHSTVPQFIVTSFVGPGSMAVLDYTCANQWTWH